MRDFFDFEKPVAELEKKIEKLKSYPEDKIARVSDEIKRLEEKAAELQREIFARLTPWQKTMIARHISRPHTLDYVNLLMTDFIELHGDRNFGDDNSIVGGTAKFENIPVVVIGHQKGQTVKENVYRNFGMPNPEGYRKALRLMRFAEKFSKPIITFIDTPGAYPGINAEERGQAEAIARNLMEMAHLKTAIIVVVAGEGGSGGALALGVGDRILMFEHSIYSVISPEGCAAILWNDSSRAAEAAETLKLTAVDLYKFKVIDEIIEEPLGGAHRDQKEMAGRLGRILIRHLSELKNIPIAELIQKRYERFRNIGVFSEQAV
ncbi:MAG: acetyl-CoA carboxylase carboxyltransferase subunit alpha [Nitrospirae bacterium]|nr:acetyl-CoA carboxylase carboxyltransferase subunit alpha [Nitrospirota bacterium]